MTAECSNTAAVAFPPDSIPWRTPVRFERQRCGAGLVPALPAASAAPPRAVRPMPIAAQPGQAGSQELVKGRGRARPGRALDPLRLRAPALKDPRLVPVARLARVERLAQVARRVPVAVAKDPPLVRVVGRGPRAAHGRRLVPLRLAAARNTRSRRETYVPPYRARTIFFRSLNSILVCGTMETT
jgi:hypothetical protein